MKLLQLSKVMMLKLIISPRLLHMIKVMHILLVHPQMLRIELFYFALLKFHKYIVILHHMLNLICILLFVNFFPHKQLFRGRNHNQASFLLNSKIFSRKHFLY